MKRNTIIMRSLAIGLILISSCYKDPALTGSLSSQISVTTTALSAVGQNTAASGVQVAGGFSSDILDKGICWGTTANPTISSNKLSGGTGSGMSALTLTNLTPATSYYVRGYAVTKNETLYGEQQHFTSLSYQLATLTTTAVTGITLTSASGGGNVTALGGGAVTAKGVCWSTVTSPTINNSKTIDGTGLGAYSSNLSPLNPGTLYYVRAYATNQAGTVYGPQVSFTTVSIVLATLATPGISSITQTTAASSAAVLADGGGTITARGICWNTSVNPTIANARTLDGSGLGAYNSLLSNLNPGTVYYVRSYATNQAGTAYSAQTSFTTVAVQLATAGSVTVSGITKTSATISGSVTADGGGTITSRGVCWSTGTNPTVPVSPYTSNGSGTGAVGGSLTGLVTGTTYYVRAYAINAAGTAYGALTSFKTL